MPSIRRVTDDFAVAPQLTPEDVPALGGRLSLLINNRPDGEAHDQPAHEDMEAAAREAGLDYVFVPISGLPRPEQAEAMREAVGRAEGPALAFCRSGTRSIVAWALGEALAGRPPGELRRLAARAGYDVGPALQALLPELSG